MKMRNETIKILINYDIFKLATNGQKRTISNYLEYATLNYSMNEILKYEENIKKVHLIF